jgi:drug/metabolite transporter (DMT)-like permease
MGYWWAGAILAILASVASNAGVNLQRYNFIQRELRGVSPSASYWRDRYYVFGLSLVIFGSLFDFAALSMAALSIVAPIGSTTLVANIFFAHYWLKEQLNRADISGTALIIFGSTIAVSFGNHSEHEFTIQQLLAF